MIRLGDYFLDFVAPGESRGRSYSDTTTPFAVSAWYSPMNEYRPGPSGRLSLIHI